LQDETIVLDPIGHSAAASGLDFLDELFDGPGVVKSLPVLNTQRSFMDSSCHNGIRSAFDRLAFKRLEALLDLGV